MKLKELLQPKITLNDVYREPKKYLLDMDNFELFNNENFDVDKIPTDILSLAFDKYSKLFPDVDLDELLI